MNNLIDIISKYNIIGFGECSHGQQKINEYRFNVFKELVKKHKFNTIVVEENYDLCYLLNNYIKTGQGNIKSILNDCHHPWQSIIMIKIIKWMRQWNINNTTKLKFVGIDIQDKSSFQVNKVSYHNNTYKYWNKLIKNNKSRDYNMYLMFKKIYNTKDKYFIIAHNDHLRNKPFSNHIDAFGQYMNKYYSTKYYCIANTFNNGYYRAMDPKKEYNLVNVSAKNYCSFDKKFQNEKYMFIDRHKVKTYDNLKIKSCTGLKDIIDCTKIDAFDGILLLDNETPLRLF